MIYNTQSTYDYTKFGSVQSPKSITEPDQALTIREILFRYRVGNLPPLSVYDKYGDDGEEQSVSNRGYDLSDIPTRFEDRGVRINIVPTSDEPNKDTKLEDSKPKDEDDSKPSDEDKPKND